MFKGPTLQSFRCHFILCFSVVAGWLSSCSHHHKPMFEVLKPAQTGINFINYTQEGPQLNILYYLYYYNGAGVAAGDINNDGWTDLFFTANHKGGNKLYLNKGNWTFEDITVKAGVAGTSDWNTGVTMADVNGDGLLDIYTCAVAGSYGLQGHHELYLNLGNGTFTTAAEEMGIQFSGLGTQAVFFDYDHDGDLDLYLLNHSRKPHSNIVHANNRKNFDPIAGDKLYKHEVVDGRIKFMDVTEKAGIFQSNLGYGLGISVADFNNDGWEDIFIGNDFHENDYYYLNNGDGTFTESGTAHFAHYSRFSMGNDAADYNNDGQIDLITVDMLPPDEKTLKTYGSDENPNNYMVKLTLNGYQDQVSRNCLHTNIGNGVAFSETALLAGVAATDWSWSPLFADFDNDGNKDLFISSGIVKRPVDLDYVQFVSAQQFNKGLEMTDRFDQETINRMPDGATHPFFFKGTGTHQFEAVSQSWGTSQMKGYYNGAAWADLDNDGDLDVVINSLHANAVVLQNNTTTHNALQVYAEGTGGNTKGIGLKVWVFSADKIQYQQLMPSRGFMSGSQPVLHFGLGGQSVDSVLVVWPGGAYEVCFPADSGLTRLMVRQQDAAGDYDYTGYFKHSDSLLIDVTSKAGVSWKHQENDFSDFNRQYLLPHKLSTRGPKAAVGDVNGDGLQDFYVCGAMNQPGVLMLQQANGTFIKGKTAPFEANALCEEVDCLLLDADADGHLDLYVASGGYQFDNGNSLLADHLYFNDGKGNFEERKEALPSILVNTSTIAAADIDGDGDIDLFTGSLAQAGRYGYAVPSHLLLNDGKGNFTAASLLPFSPDEEGMVTAAVFHDLNGDSLPELIIAGEWMPITIYINQKKGVWTRETLPSSNGWWQSLALADADGDGMVDVVAGNWGLNSKWTSGKDGKVKMYVKDFDKNGREEQILTYSIQGKEYTFYAKDELERALPVLKKAYLTYSEVAGQTVQYMFYDLFTDYREWQAETMATTAYLCKGNTLLTPYALPALWQVAPVYSVTPYAGGSRMAMGGNFAGTVPYEGKYLSMPLSLFEVSMGQSNPRLLGTYGTLAGEVRDIKPIVVNGKEHLLVVRNNAPILLLYPRRQ